jgi:hypothetical protein
LSEHPPRASTQPRRAPREGGTRSTAREPGTAAIVIERVASTIGFLTVASAVAGTISVRSWRDAQADRLVGQAAAELEAARWDRAESMLLRLRSPTIDAWVLRARLAIARGRTELALDALSHVADSHPMAPWA